MVRARAGALLSAEATTDGEGWYSFEGIPLDSELHLFAAVQGLVPRKRLQASLVEEGKTLLRDIDLVPASSVGGRVLDPEGRPVPGALVEVIAVTDNDQDGVHLRWRKEILAKPQLETDASGSFQAEDILPLGKLFLWAYHPDLGEGFAGPVHLQGDGDTARLEVTLHAAALEVGVKDASGQPVEGLDVELIAEVIWDALPRGMSMIEWYRQRTSMDLSYYARGLDLVPGARKARTAPDGSCRWTDLTAGRYQVSVARILSGRDLPDFQQDYFYYWGTLEEPLGSRGRSRLEVRWVQDRRLRGPTGARRAFPVDRVAAAR